MSISDLVDSWFGETEGAVDIPEQALDPVATPDIAHTERDYKKKQDDQ